MIQIRYRLFTIPGSVSGLPGQRNRIYEWVKENFDAIAERLPPQFIAFLPLVASGCSEERLADAQVFFSEPSHSGVGTEARLETVAEQVGDCVSLREREGFADATASLAKSLTSLRDMMRNDDLTGAADILEGDLVDEAEAWADILGALADGAMRRGTNE